MNVKNTNTIAPCPFCGNAAQSRLDAIKDVDAWIYCDACSACGPTKPTENEAIAAWNRVGALLRAARALWEAEQSQATLEAAHYPSEPPDDLAGDAFGTVRDAWDGLGAALAALDGNREGA